MQDLPQNNQKNLSSFLNHSTNGHNNRKQQKVDCRIQTWKRSSKIKTSPSAIIGKSGRKSLENRDGPGPGAYDLRKESSLDKKMISFKGNRLMRCHTDSPGPGTYQPSSMFSSKKYSFSRCKKSILNEIRPGPGAYTIKKTDTSQAFGFSKKERESLNDKSKESIPGPGNYFWKDLNLSKQDYSFAKTKKFLEEEQEIHQKQVIPGPGAYQTAKARHKMQTYKFSQALRDLDPRVVTPGPGCYETDMSAFLQNGRTISKEKREFKYENGVPGPGNYREVSVQSLKQREPRVAFSRSQTDNPRKKIEVGPGAYFKQHHTKIPGGVIGREKRNPIQESLTPSPLNYNPNYDEVLSRSAKIVFPKQQRITSAYNKTPGPGYYNIEGASKSIASSQFKRANPTQFEIRRTSEPEGRINITTMSHQ